jgi:hypothetical protein
MTAYKFFMAYLVYLLVLPQPFKSSIGHCSTSTIHLLAHTLQAKYWQLSQSLKGWQYLQPLQRLTAFSLSIISLQKFLASLILLISNRVQITQCTIVRLSIRRY